VYLKNKFWTILGTVLGAVIIINIISWLSHPFSNWYTRFIFPVWVNTYGRITSLLPFVLGEVLIVVALIAILVAFVLGILYFVLKNKTKFRRFVTGYEKCMAIIFVAVCVIMTLNCTILYHCSPLDSNPNLEEREYKISELETLRNYIVDQCNEWAEKLTRDENGYIVYEGDIYAESVEALLDISDDYGKLDGYYPKIKPLAFSNLMSQARIAGYYLPFSMESTYNNNMYIANYPAVYCHELSHIRGYIYEDEANFLAFYACIHSENPFFVYCGYLSVLSYVNEAYFKAIDNDMERYMQQKMPSKHVIQDNIFLTEEAWAKVNQSAVISSETVHGFSNSFTNTSLQLNGVSDGSASYTRVVGLLLHYYDGQLY